MPQPIIGQILGFAATAATILSSTVGILRFRKKAGTPE